MTQPLCRRNERFTAFCNKLMAREAPDDLAPAKYLDMAGYAHSSPRFKGEPLTPQGQCHLRFNGMSMVGWHVEFESRMVTRDETLEGSSQMPLTRFMKELRSDLRAGVQTVPQAHLTALVNLREEAKIRMEMKRQNALRQD